MSHCTEASSFQQDGSGGAVKPPSMTVVVCIESGILEPLTQRMVDSLRRFGERFANLDVVAVTPRLGPSLAPEARRRMVELGIEYLRVRPNHPYGCTTIYE